MLTVTFSKQISLKNWGGPQYETETYTETITREAETPEDKLKLQIEVVNSVQKLINARIKSLQPKTAGANTETPEGHPF